MTYRTIHVIMMHVDQVPATILDTTYTLVFGILHVSSS